MLYGEIKKFSSSYIFFEFICFCFDILGLKAILPFPALRFLNNLKQNVLRDSILSSKLDLLILKTLFLPNRLQNTFIFIYYLFYLFEIIRIINLITKLTYFYANFVVNHHDSQFILKLDLFLP